MKHSSVSHRSTESEVISLDAGLRMGGIPALDLWDLVVEVLHSSQFGESRGETKPKEKTHQHQHQDEETR